MSRMVGAYYICVLLRAFDVWEPGVTPPGSPFERDGWGLEMQTYLKHIKVRKES
jgi:hypothetical protein